MGSSKPPVFLRESTGLVREISALDAAAINWTGETLVLGLLTSFVYSFLFPGGDLVIGMIISVVCFIPLSLTYAMSIAAMPRSGGDYVFVSRALHPAIGLTLVLTLNVWFAFWSGAYGNWIFTLGLGPALSVVGNVINSPSVLALSTTVSSPLVATVGGAVAIIITALIAIVSTKITTRLITLFVGIGFISLAAICIIFLANSNQQFQAAFNAYSSSFANSPNYYNTVLGNASKAGFTQPGFSWSDTIALVPFEGSVFLYISEMQAVGGEMKRATKSAYSACVLTIVVGGLLAVLICAAFQNTVTLAFSHALGFIYANGAGYSLPVTPTYNYLASMLTNNVFVVWLLNIGFMTTNIALMLMYYVFTPRYFLATAFDRVMPEKLASVSEKYHSPHVAIIFAMVLALITLPIYSYFATMLATLSVIFSQIVFGYLIFGIASVVFPFRKNTKPIYDASPIKKSILGIPVMSILGVLNCAVLAYLGYMMLINSAYGANNATSLTAAIAIAVAGPIWYYARKAYLNRKGIDLGIVFGVIPPE